MRLPVRTALLQNSTAMLTSSLMCDYQSERHCSKTPKVSLGALASAITSQNGTAPKQQIVSRKGDQCAITSQNGTAPKPALWEVLKQWGAITSQNGTAPKLTGAMQVLDAVRLPVRTALLQNRLYALVYSHGCDYQSERHCSKTGPQVLRLEVECDYQSERHCSKTRTRGPVREDRCDYQSERHCSKTAEGGEKAGGRAITSQNGTAPKHCIHMKYPCCCAITSQNGTAPKPQLHE